jgi:hypothetical protein
MSFNPDQTSKRVSSLAGSSLGKKSSSPTLKSLAGSALAQTPYKGGGALTKAARKHGYKKMNVGKLMGSIRKSF